MTIDETTDDALTHQKPNGLFDVRNDGFYRKVGGLRTLMQYAIKHDIQIYGTKITTDQLSIIIAAYNEDNQDNRLKLDSTGNVCWEASSGRMDETTLATSTLEDTLFSIEKRYEPATAIQPTAIAPTAPSPAPEPKKSLMEQYYSTLSNKTYNIEDIAKANSILQEMIDNRVNDFTTESLDHFISRTSFFVSKYRHPSLFQTAEKLLEYVGSINKKKFSERSLEMVQEIIDKATYINSYSHAEIKDHKAYAQLNLEAFKFFSQFGRMGRNTTFVRLSAYYHLNYLQKIFCASPQDAEKKSIADHCIEFCDTMLKGDVVMDTVTLANTHYFEAYYRHERSRLKNDPSDRNSAVLHMQSAKNFVNGIHNRKISQNLKENLETLERRMKGK